MTRVYTAGLAFLTRQLTRRGLPKQRTRRVAAEGYGRPRGIVGELDDLASRTVTTATNSQLSSTS